MASFEWDHNKRRSNLDKHGIDFADAVRVFEDPARFTCRSRYPVVEVRYVTVGRIGDRLIAVISTSRGDRVRIISARTARKVERDRYGRT